MIAPTKPTYSTRVRNLGVVSVGPDPFATEQASAGERAMEVTKQWVSRHPTTAVVASIVLGLLAGYVVKRHNR